MAYALFDFRERCQLVLLDNVVEMFEPFLHDVGNLFGVLEVIISDQFLLDLLAIILCLFTGHLPQACDDTP